MIVDGIDYRRHPRSPWWLPMFELKDEIRDANSMTRICAHLPPTEEELDRYVHTGRYPQAPNLP